MPWVLFTGDFNYKPRRNVVLAYKAGTKALVKQECAELAIKADKAQATQKRQEEHASGRPA